MLEGKGPLRNGKEKTSPLACNVYLVFGHVGILKLALMPMERSHSQSKWPAAPEYQRGWNPLVLLPQPNQISQISLLYSSTGTQDSKNYRSGMIQQGGRLQFFYFRGTSGLQGVKMYEPLIRLLQGAKEKHQCGPHPCQSIC
jgi:hypothetical protein